MVVVSHGKGKRRRARMGQETMCKLALNVAVATRIIMDWFNYRSELHILNFYVE